MSERVSSKGGSARLSGPLYGGVCLRGAGEPRLLMILVVTSTFTSENGAVVSDRCLELHTMRCTGYASSVIIIYLFSLLSKNC